MSLMGGTADRQKLRKKKLKSPRGLHGLRQASPQLPPVHTVLVLWMMKILGVSSDDQREDVRHLFPFSAGFIDECVIF